MIQQALARWYVRGRAPLREWDTPFEENHGNFPQ
jgi:hypothetical protein